MAFMAKTSGLTVRQYERREIELPAELEIAHDLRVQIAFSSTSGLTNPHRIECHTLDVSPGGVGLSVRTFLPRGARGRLWILDPASSGQQEDGSPMHAVLFEHDVKVRRVSLSGHEPTYFLGISFDNQASDFEAKIGRFLGMVGQRAATPELQEDVDRA